jgi:hypothetical protein
VVPRHQALRLQCGAHRARLIVDLAPGHELRAVRCHRMADEPDPIAGVRGQLEPSDRRTTAGHAITLVVARAIMGYEATIARAALGLVVAQFDGETVGVADVERRAVAACAVAGVGAVEHLEAPAAGQGGQVGRLDHHTNVVERTG